MQNSKTVTILNFFDYLENHFIIICSKHNKGSNVEYFTKNIKLQKCTVYEYAADKVFSSASKISKYRKDSSKTPLLFSYFLIGLQPTKGFVRFCLRFQYPCI